jgi:hypothetical protein
VSTLDRIRAASLANHALHGAEQDTALDAYDYLANNRGGEIRELLEALVAYVNEPTTAARAHVVAEVGDCATLLDFILHRVGGGTLVAAVEGKLAADRVKLAGRAKVTAGGGPA